MDASNQPEGAVGLRDGQLTTGYAQYNSEPVGLGDLQLASILTAIKRNRLLIAGMTLLGLLVGFLITAATPNVYEASAQIEVNPENLRAVEIEGQERQSAGIDMIFLQTQLELLRTRVLRERVVRKLRLDVDSEVAGTPKARLDAAVRRLDGAVSVSQQPDTRLFRINVEDTDPAQAARIANAYAEEFIALNIERQLDVSSFAREYLSDQIKDTRTNLENSERALVEYARSQGIISLTSPGEDGTNSESLAVRSLADVNSALIEARVRRINAEQKMRFETAKPDNMAERSALQGQLAALRAEYDQKGQLFKPEYPEMVALQQRISSLEQSLAGLRSQGRGEVMRSLRNEYNAALGEERQLQQQLAELETSALSERGVSIQYNILKRDVDTNAAQYDALLERFKQVGTAATQVQNLISIVEPASVPTSQVRPNLSVNLALGLIGGLALGLVIAVLTSILSGRIRSMEDIEQLLQEKALGAIPRGDFGSIVTEIADPKSEIFEAFLSLANRMRFATQRGFPRLMSLSSTLPSEGKSSSTFCLAHVLARQGRRVIVVDADLRMPTFLGLERNDVLPELTKQVRATKGRGVTEILIGEATPAEVIVSVNERFDLLLNGDTPPNPAELLSSQTWAQLVHDLTEKYDHVIIDTPPVLGLADAPMVASMVNATLFVVQSDRALRQQIRNAIRRLRDNNGKVIGVLLTQVAAADAGEAYEYYQYSYGASDQSPTGIRRWLQALRR